MILSPDSENLSPELHPLNSHYNINIKISWYFTPEIFGEVTDAYLEPSLKKKPCWPGHLIDGTDQEGPCLAYQQIIWIPDLMHRSQNLSQEVIGKNWHTKKHDGFV